MVEFGEPPACLGHGSTNAALTMLMLRTWLINCYFPVINVLKNGRTEEDFFYIWRFITINYRVEIVILTVDGNRRRQGQALYEASSEWWYYKLKRLNSCKGNICRSLAASEVLKAELSDSFMRSYRIETIESLLFNLLHNLFIWNTALVAVFNCKAVLLNYLYLIDFYGHNFTNWSCKMACARLESSMCFLYQQSNYCRGRASWSFVKLGWHSDITIGRSIKAIRSSSGQIQYSYILY